MRRKRLRAALLVVVAVALAGIGYQTARSIMVRKVDRMAKEIGEQLLPQVAQQLKNFKRVKVEKGRMVWDITADDAQFFQENGEVVVASPKVTLYLTDGRRQAHITGKEGRLHLNGKDVRTIDLVGDVKVTLDDLQFTAERATYDEQDDVIHVPGDIVLVGNTVDVRGHGLEMHVKPQVVRVLRGVTTVLQGHDAKS